MIRLRSDARRTVMALVGASAGLILALALVYRFGPLGLVLPAGGVAAAVLLQRPGLCLGVYLGLLVLVEQSPPSLLPGAWLHEERAAGISPATALLAVLTVSVALDAARHQRVPPLHRGIAVGLGMLACAIAAGSVTAYFAGVAITEIYDNLLNLLPLVLVPILVITTLDSRERVRTALAVAAGLVVAKAAVGVVAVLGGLTTPDVGLGSDASGTRATYYEPTVNWLSLGLLLVGASAVIRRVDLPRWVLWAMPVVAASLVLSYRRSFWIGTILGLLVVLLFGASRLQRRLAIPTAVIVAAALWVTFTLGGVTERLGGAVVERAQSLNPAKAVASREDRYRLDERANVLAEIRAHPVSGLGFGVPWTARVPLPVENTEGRQYVHFAFLWFWMRLGILGAVAYLALYAGGVLAGLRVSRRHPDPLLACVGLALMGAFAGLALAETTATFIGSDSRFSSVFGAALGLLGALRSSTVETGAPLTMTARASSRESRAGSGDHENGSEAG